MQKKTENCFLYKSDPPRPMPLSGTSMEGTIIPRGVDFKPFTDLSILWWIYHPGIDVNLSHISSIGFFYNSL